MSINTNIVIGRPSHIKHINAKCSQCGESVCLYHTHVCPKCGGGQFYPMTRKSDGKPMFITEVTLHPKRSKFEEELLMKKVASTRGVFDDRGVQKRVVTISVILKFFSTTPLEGTLFAQPHALAPYILYGRDITIMADSQGFDEIQIYESKKYQAYVGARVIEVGPTDKVVLSHTLEEVNQMPKLLPLPNVDQNGKRIFPNPLTTPPFTPAHPTGEKVQMVGPQTQPVQQPVTPMTPQPQQPVNQVNFHNPAPQPQMPAQPQGQYWGPQTTGQVNPTPQAQPATVQGPVTFPMPGQPQMAAPQVPQTQPVGNNVDESGIEDPFASC